MRVTGMGKSFNQKWTCFPILLGSKELSSSTLCFQVQFAQRKKFTEVVRHPLYMAKCTVLANHYFGFNGWSTKIVQVVKLSCWNILNLFCYDHLEVLINLFQLNRVMYSVHEKIV